MNIKETENIINRNFQIQRENHPDSKISIKARNQNEILFNILRYTVIKCKETKINNSISEVKEYLKNSWLLRFSDMDLKGKNTLLVHSSASFGRYTCSIEYRDGKVVNTDYSYLD